jgi:hypothetical protein
MVIGMDTQTVRCLIDFKSMGNLPPAEKLSYEQTDGKRVTFAASRSAEREVVRRIISRTHIENRMRQPPPALTPFSGMHISAPD